MIGDSLLLLLLKGLSAFPIKLTKKNIFVKISYYSKNLMKKKRQNSTPLRPMGTIEQEQKKS